MFRILFAIALSFVSATPGEARTKATWSEPQWFALPATGNAAKLHPVVGNASAYQWVISTRTGETTAKLRYQVPSGLEAGGLDLSESLVARMSATSSPPAPQAAAVEPMIDTHPGSTMIDVDDDPPAPVGDPLVGQFQQANSMQQVAGMQITQMQMQMMMPGP